MSASRKMPWFRSMNATLNYEKQLENAAIKVAEGQKLTVSLPKDKGGKDKPKKLTMFQALVEKAKEDKQKRKAKKDKNNKNTESSNK